MHHIVCHMLLEQNRLRLRHSVLAVPYVYVTLVTLVSRHYERDK